MLELKNIKKDYPAGDGTVHALKGISRKFRDNDFVSILGPSGCGKTTMLNIIGVLVTWLLCIPINLILHHLTGIGNLSAFLPLPVALILIAISMALTLIAGIIPSRSAAKKDPVVALRTE